MKFYTCSYNSISNSALIVSMIPSSNFLITEVNLRHHLPVGMTYPDSVTISGNGQPSSVAMLKECKRLERLYGRPVVRCGKLDFMIRAIEPQLKPTTPRSVLKQRKGKALN